MGSTTKLNWRFLNHQRYYWTVSFNCQFAFLTAHFMFGWGFFLLFRFRTKLVIHSLQLRFFSANWHIPIFQIPQAHVPQNMQSYRNTNIKKATTWKKHFDATCVQVFETVNLIIPYHKFYWFISDSWHLSLITWYQIICCILACL